MGGGFSSLRCLSAGEAFSLFWSLELFSQHIVSLPRVSLSPFLILFSSSFSSLPSSLLKGPFDVLHCCSYNLLRVGPLRGTLGPPQSVYKHED